MPELNAWLDEFLRKLNVSFGSRVWFVGLQGSYGRGEATENSDIDMVVILDNLSPSDIQTYNEMLDTMPHRELICGFLSGKTELLHWDPADLFQLYYDTKPILGSMDAVIPMLDQVAVDRAIKLGACNIYHGCVHNMLYGKSEKTLRGLYKMASFVVQAICFRQTGRYVSRQTDLLEAVNDEERLIIKNFLQLKNGEKVDFLAMSETLFAWSGGWIEKTK